MNNVSKTNREIMTNSSIIAPNEEKLDNLFLSYLYVDKDIRCMLTTHSALASDNNKETFWDIDPKTLCINRWKKRNTNIASDVQVEVDINDLIALAQLSENILFPPSSEAAAAAAAMLPPYIQKLIKICQKSDTIDSEESAECVMTTQLLIGMLELEIRTLVQYLQQQANGNRGNTKEGGKNSKKRKGSENIISSTKGKISPMGSGSSSGGVGGGALLKDIIELIAPLSPTSSCQTNTVKGGTEKQPHEELECLAGILRVLLLPNEGRLNLRNLLWHGFLETLHRKWLALVVVLTVTISSIKETSTKEKWEDECNVTSSSAISGDVSPSTLLLSDYEPFHVLIQQGKGCIANLQQNSEMLISNKLSMMRMIPTSHHEIFRAALRIFFLPSHDQLKTKSLLHSPSSFVAVISPLIEHSLRLQWCHHNHRPDEAIARTAQYYVTLDGFGQRNKHELLLTHHRAFDGSENELLKSVGERLWGILSDLFVSPCGGPNVRSALAHGLYDDQLKHELERQLLESKETTTTGTNTNSLFMEEVAYTLVAVLDIWSSPSTANASCTGTNMNDSNNVYQPCFSYTADTVRLINALMDVLLLTENAAGVLQSDDEKEEEAFAVSISSDIAFLDMVLDNALPMTPSRITYADLIIRTTNSISTKLSLSNPSFPSSENKRNIMNGDIPNRNNNDNHPAVYREHETNQSLSNCHAARCLLSEIRESLSEYNLSITKLRKQLEIDKQNDNHRYPSKKRLRHEKQLHRLMAASKVMHKFHSFAAYVALRYIENEIYGTASSKKNTNEHNQLTSDSHQANNYVGPSQHAKLSSSPSPRTKPDQSTMEQPSSSFPKPNTHLNHETSMKKHKHQNKSNQLRAVERTQMCLSTVRRFAYSNMERSFQSIHQYFDGKVIKEVVNDITKSAETK